MENAGTAAEELENIPAEKAEKTKKERKPLYIFDYDVRYFIVGMIVFAFFGFCAENAGRMVTKHIFDCRHQLLPFLFAYGIALLAVYVLMGTPDDLRFFKFRFFKNKNLKTKSFEEFHCLFTLGMSSVGIAIREFYEGTSKDEVRKLFAERIGLLKYGAFHGSGP